MSKKRLSQENLQNIDDNDKDTISTLQSILSALIPNFRTLRYLYILCFFATSVILPQTYIHYIRFHLSKHISFKGEQRNKTHQLMT